MTIATARPQDSTSAAGSAAVPDEVALAGLTELLVQRDRDDRWWDALGQRTDVLALAIAAHGTDPVGRCLAHDPGARGATAAEARDRRVRIEHAEIAREIADLRALLVSARSEPHGTSLVLAEATEIIALVRGHNRRARDTLAAAS